MARPRGEGGHGEGEGASGERGGNPPCGQSESSADRDAGGLRQWQHLGDDARGGLGVRKDDAALGPAWEGGEVGEHGPAWVGCKVRVRVRVRVTVKGGPISDLRQAPERHRRPASAPRRRGPSSRAKGVALSSRAGLRRGGGHVALITDKVREVSLSNVSLTLPIPLFRACAPQRIDSYDSLFFE